MITKERITHLRRSLERNPIDGDDVLSLLDAAEEAIALAEQVERYRKSVAITDKNFRAMQNERDTLRDLSNVLVDELDDRDGREFMHRNAPLLDAWKSLRNLVRK